MKLCLLLILASRAQAQAPDSLAISPQELGARLHYFSSDLFEGRYPGTRGEALATSYLISELQSFGLRPGATPIGSDSSGNWLQPVSLLVQRPDSGSPVVARLSGRMSRDLVPGREVTFV